MAPAGAGTRADVEPWLRLLDTLDLEEGDRGKAWLLDRMAWCVQHPGRKINHGVLLGGEKGIGKDSFLAPWLDCIGRANVNVCDGESLASDFNSYAAKAKVLVVNEIDFGSHRDKRIIAERLKPILASPPETLWINEKNLRPYETPNRVQVVLMTNHRHCMHIDEGERRYLPLWCNLKIDPAQAQAWDRYFTGYWDWVLTGGSSRVLGYLRARDVHKFSPGARPPKTAWLEELMDSSRDGLEHWLLERIAERQGVFAESAASIADIVVHMETGVGRHLLGPRLPNAGQIARALSRIGAKAIMRGYKRHRYWLFPGRSWVEGDREKIEKTATVVRIDQRRERNARHTTPQKDQREPTKPSWF